MCFFQLKTIVNFLKQILMMKKRVAKMPTSSPKSNSTSDDETEFVTTDDTIPIVKTKANLKGRLAGLAKARELKTKQQNAIKKVKEATATITKAQKLQEQATNKLNEGRTKAIEVGLTIPEVPKPDNELQTLITDMRDDIKQLKNALEVKKVEEKPTVPELQPLPEPLKPIRKRTVNKKKPTSAEKEEKKVVTVEFPTLPTINNNRIVRPKAFDESSRLAELRLLMGRT